METLIHSVVSPQSGSVAQLNRANLLRLVAVKGLKLSPAYGRLVTNNFLAAEDEVILPVYSLRVRCGVLSQAAKIGHVAAKKCFSFSPPEEEGRFFRLAVSKQFLKDFGGTQQSLLHQHLLGFINTDPSINCGWWRPNSQRQKACPTCHLGFLAPLGASLL